MTTTDEPPSVPVPGWMRRTSPSCLATLSFQVFVFFAARSSFIDTSCIFKNVLSRNVNMHDEYFHQLTAVTRNYYEKRVTWPCTAPALPVAPSPASPGAAGPPAAPSLWPAARPPSPAFQPQSETVPSAAAGASAPALLASLPPPPAACKRATRYLHTNICII